MPDEGGYENGEHRFLPRRVSHCDIPVLPLWVVFLYIISGAALLGAVNACADKLFELAFG